MTLFEYIIWAIKENIFEKLLRAVFFQKNLTKAKNSKCDELNWP